MLKFSWALKNLPCFEVLRSKTFHVQSLMKDGCRMSNSHLTYVKVAYVEFLGDCPGMFLKIFSIGNPSPNPKRKLKFGMFRRTPSCTRPWVFHFNIQNYLQRHIVGKLIVISGIKILQKKNQFSLLVVLADWLRRANLIIQNYRTNYCFRVQADHSVTFFTWSHLWSLFWNLVTKVTF